MNSDYLKTINIVKLIDLWPTEETLNHSENFVDPVSGAYTQKIGSTWRHMKAKLCKNDLRKKYLADHMFEFIWKRMYKTDRFAKLVNLIIRFNQLKQEINEIEDNVDENNNELQYKLN